MVAASTAEPLLVVGPGHVQLGDDTVERLTGLVLDRYQGLGIVSALGPEFESDSSDLTG